MQRQKVILFVLIVCLFTGLHGCAQRGTTQPTTAPPVTQTAKPTTAEAAAPAATTADKLSTGTKTVVDSIGRKVNVPTEVKRVVVIKGACMIPGILAALESGDKLISGVCFKGGKDDLQLKVQPSYASVDVITPGDNGVDIEQLASLKPDVVFVWTNVNNVEKIAQAGIPVIVSDISTWDNVRNMFTLIGEIMNKQDKARKIVDSLDATAKMIKDKVSSIPEGKKKKVMLVSTTKPLSVLGGTSHNNFMIEMTGGIPAMKDVPGHFVTVSMESILKADPNIIVVSASNKTGAQEILSWADWQSVAAVKEKQVYSAPYGVFFWDKPSAETPLFLLWQTHIQYPDLITEEELIKDTKQFYSDFFNYKLNDEEIKTIFHK